MTRTMKKVVGFVLMVCMIVSLFAGVTSAFAAKAFKDVPDGHWAKPYVDFVVDKGYFAGVSEDKFDPDGKMTRAMFVAVIGKVEGKTFDNSVSSGYTDVPSGKYYTGAVKWATENKIVAGIGDNKYGPNLPITRQDICVMMDKYIQYHDANNKEKFLDRDASVEFKDASDISNYAKESVQKCVSYGLIQGYPDGKFLPKKNASRAEVAVMIYRLALYIEEETKPTEFKAEYKFVSGTEGKKLDSKVEALLPSDANKYKDGDTVKAVNPSEATVMTDDGVWTFAGYDKKEAKVEKANVVFTGKWTFAAVDTKEYSVTYKFVSGTEGAELPAALSAAPYLPVDEQKYLSGETVKAKQPGQTELATLQGTWTFTGYDKQSAVVDHKDVVFTGTWERSPLTPTTFSVRYVFVDEKGESVPAQVTASAAPVDLRRVSKGQKVAPQAPRATSVRVGDDVWEFVSYDKDEKTVEDQDVVFTAKWKKTSATKKYKVTYKNTINSLGVTVPDAVKKELDSRLPAEKSYATGDRVALDTPVQGTYATKEGTWTYIRLDPVAYSLTRSVTIADSDVEVAWVWLLIPSRSYTVTYQYDYSGVALTDQRAVRETLPTDDTRYYTGDEATILQPSSVRVQDSNRKGAYVFNGWEEVEEDQKTVEIENANVTLRGTWTRYDYVTVKYDYIADPGEFPKDVKDKVKATVPTDSEKYVPGDKVTVQEPNGEKAFWSDDAKAQYIYDKVIAPGATVKDGSFTLPDGQAVNGVYTLKGSWKKTTEYAVLYSFEDQDGKAIKDKALLEKLGLPETEYGKKDQETVSPAAITKQTVNYGGYEYIWQGYKGEQIRKINKANVEYVGVWKKTKTYKATYKFVSKNATDTLDSKIVKLYREEYEAGTPDLKDKTEFTPKAITQTFSDTATGGTWKFKGWNPPKATVNGKDLEFTGTWELTK